MSKLRVGIDWSNGHDYTSIAVYNPSTGKIENYSYGEMMSIKWWKNPLQWWKYRKIIKALKEAR